MIELSIFYARENFAVILRVFLFLAIFYKTYMTSVTSPSYRHRDDAAVRSALVWGRKDLGSTPVDVTWRWSAAFWRSICDQQKNPKVPLPRHIHLHRRNNTYRPMKSLSIAVVTMVACANTASPSSYVPRGKSAPLWRSGRDNGGIDLHNKNGPSDNQKNPNPVCRPSRAKGMRRTKTKSRRKQSQHLILELRAGGRCRAMRQAAKEDSNTLPGKTSSNTRRAHWNGWAAKHARIGPRAARNSLSGFLPQTVRGARCSSCVRPIMIQRWCAVLRSAPPPQPPWNCNGRCLKILRP